jgi:hypothetical protein
MSVRAGFTVKVGEAKHEPAPLTNVTNSRTQQTDRLAILANTNAIYVKNAVFKFSEIGPAPINLPANRAFTEKQSEAIDKKGRFAPVGSGSPRRSKAFGARLCCPES